MGDLTVSVIIPVYKTEQFLEECLDSVIGQDYPALEIILVDDGSPDSCPEMCDLYAEKYGHIKTIHTSNGGPGMARNAGLEAATGKYITFLDSDDCLDGMGAIRCMVEQAEKKQADIVIGSYRRLSGQQISEIKHHQLQDGAYTETADFRFKGFTSGHLSFPWGKLYCRAFLTEHDLKYRDYPFLEDKFFNMVCYIYKPVYAFVDDSVYLYRINDDSIIHQYQDHYMSVWISIASDFEMFLSECGITEGYSDLIAFHVCVGLFFLVTQNLMHKKRISETVKALSRYGKNPLVRRMVKMLVRGRYVDQIERKVWKLMIWETSLLCSLHAYILLVLGTWVLQKVKGAKSS